MARDVLVVQISSVASESAFNTRGRVLRNFRSSLTTAIIEALICAEDWLWSTSPGIFDPEEEENENEQLEFKKGKFWHLYFLSPKCILIAFILITSLVMFSFRRYGFELQCYSNNNVCYVF
ncbi:Putative AC transposase [Linum perenne]